jgi:hypothetical protein
VTARVIRAPPPPVDSASSSTVGSLFFWVFPVLCCVLFLFPPVQSVRVLLKFYRNLCWLVAKLSLFYLRVSVNVRYAQM